MKYFYFTLWFVSSMFSMHAYASELILDETRHVQSGLISFDVLLDTQTDDINAAAGSISIPADYFDIESISIKGSIVPLWLTSPAVSLEKNLDQRTRIIFEGIFPGGFTGVRSPYYTGTQAGKLFTITLRPKKAGETLVLLENIDMRINDGKATKVPQESIVNTISIPELNTLPKVAHSVQVPSEVVDSSIQPFITKTEIGGKENWLLTIHDDTNDKTPKGYFVAESKSSNPADIYFYEWKSISFPYVLSYQTRNRFIHIKVEYDDGTFSYTTLPPVENTDDTNDISRILILIAIALIFGYVLKQKYRTKK